MFRILLLLGLLPLCLRSQPVTAYPDSVENKLLEVGRVLIIGNKITRDRIILRELSLQPGDTISSVNLNELLKRDRNKIYNLRLFNTVTIRPISIEVSRIDLLVEVSERWYTFPSPIL
jgi:outer membrane protein assembly factor BamA